MQTVLLDVLGLLLQDLLLLLLQAFLLLLALLLPQEHHTAPPWALHVHIRFRSRSSIVAEILDLLDAVAEATQKAACPYAGAKAAANLMHDRPRPLHVDDAHRAGPYTHLRANAT